MLFESAADMRPVRPRSDTPRESRGPEPLRRKRPAARPASASRRRKALNVLLGFAAVVLFIDALVGDKGLVERLRARRQYQEVQASVDQLRSENAQLRAYARRLREDPSAYESIAREELGYIRQGETLFIIKDVKPKDGLER